MHIAKHEIWRKLIHLSSIIYPVVYYIFFDRPSMIALTSLLCVLIFSLELLRRKSHILNNAFCKYLRIFLRSHEHNSITSATFFMCGVFFTVLLFQKNIAITALCVLIISDTCASAIGLSIGKYKIYGNKTLEGSVGFLISSLLIAYIAAPIMHLSLMGLILAAISTSIFELFSKFFRIDDNLLIPLAFATSYNLACTL